MTLTALAVSPLAENTTIQVGDRFTVPEPFYGDRIIEITELRGLSWTGVSWLEFLDRQTDLHYSPFITGPEAKSLHRESIRQQHTHLAVTYISCPRNPRLVGNTTTISEASLRQMYKPVAGCAASLSKSGPQNSILPQKAAVS